LKVINISASSPHPTSEFTTIMPSPPNSYALITLWNYDSTPWNWPAWQQLTSIPHGLFPDNDALLPHGLTRKDGVEIKSYFAHFLAKPKEKHLRLHNEKSGVIPGCDKWKMWVAATWRQWKLHLLVVNTFNENNINPNQIYRVSKLTNWPDAQSYITTVLDTLGSSLFGEELLDEIGHLCNPLRQSINVIAQSSWNLMWVQHTRAQKELDSVKHAAMTAFQGLYNHFFWSSSTHNAVHRSKSWWSHHGNFFLRHKGHGKMVQFCRSLAVAKTCWRLTRNWRSFKSWWCLWVLLLMNVGDIIFSVFLLLTYFLADSKSTKACNWNAPHLASEADVDYLDHLYQDLLDIPEDDSPPLQVEPQLNTVFADLEGDGSLGVEPEMAMNPDQLADELGVTNWFPLLFNQHHHKTGFVVWNMPTLFNNPARNPDIVPLCLHWHQLAGLHTILLLCFSSKLGKILNPSIEWYLPSKS